MDNKRVRVNVLIDENIKNEAKKQGINLSRFLEYKLKELIKEMKNGGTGLNEEVAKCGEPDLNRRTPIRVDPKSTAFDQARQSPHLK